LTRGATIAADNALSCHRDGAEHPERCRRAAISIHPKTVVVTTRQIVARPSLAKIEEVNRGIRDVLETNYIKVDQPNDEHKEEMEVLALSWSASNPGTMLSAVRGAGKATFSDFQITKRVDKASLNLLKMCATLERLEATLQFGKVDFESKPQKPNGSLDAGIQFKYDIKANQEG
jgi:type VI secretion system secreted protein Hcp